VTLLKGNDDNDDADEDAVCDSEDDERVNASTETTKSDMDERALLLDAREAVDEKDDVLVIVELEPMRGIDEAEAGMALLPVTLVGAGEGVTDPELTWPAAGGTPDAYG
jgi:hypothetical protein